MAKITVGYFIDSENKKWLAAEASKQQRSASWLLNRLLTQMREEANEAKQ